MPGFADTHTVSAIGPGEVARDRCWRGGARSVLERWCAINVLIPGMSRGVHLFISGCRWNGERVGGSEIKAETNFD